MDGIIKTLSTQLDQSIPDFVFSLDCFDAVYGPSANIKLQKEDKEYLKMAITSIPLPKTAEEKHADLPLPDCILRDQHLRILELQAHEKSLIEKCEANIALVDHCMKMVENATNSKLSIRRSVTKTQRFHNIFNDFNEHKQLLANTIQQLFNENSTEMCNIVGDLIDSHVENANTYILIPIATPPKLLTTLLDACIIAVNPEHKLQIKYV